MGHACRKVRKACSQPEYACCEVELLSREFEALTSRFEVVTSAVELVNCEAGLADFGWEHLVSEPEEASSGREPPAPEQQISLSRSHLANMPVSRLFQTLELRDSR
jgi:hypothetical protein